MSDEPISELSFRVWTDGIEFYGICDQFPDLAFTAATRGDAMAGMMETMAALVRASEDPEIMAGLKASAGAIPSDSN
jgi:hypothetical protein